MIKLRETRERTPESLVLEMPYNVLGKGQEWREGEPPRWRHMKMACGENIRRVYKQVRLSSLWCSSEALIRGAQTRMDLAYNFRSSLEIARKIKRSQDEFCEAALFAHSKGEVLAAKFPDDLEWEALVDVLRGKVRFACFDGREGADERRQVLVNAHCYESTDFSALIRHSNEFKFPIAAVSSFLGSTSRRAETGRAVPPCARSVPRSRPDQDGVELDSCGRHLCDQVSCLLLFERRC